MKIRMSLAALMVASFISSSAQITPNPRQITAGEKAYCGHKATYRLNGAAEADSDAVRALRAAIKEDAAGTVEIIIGEAGDAAVEPYADKIPQTPEGYYLSVTAPGTVVIAGRDGSGTFYGVQSFLQLAKSCVPTIEVIDAPVMAKRGVIEGFYGNPWSQADRLSQFDFYGRHKMNTYVYGPKDDPYHHSRWFEPYPAVKAREIADLTRAAKANKVKFIWAMHPSNSIETKEDRQKALDKFRQMYDLGVRHFGIFFDDISARSVDMQIDYLNFLDREFVKKHHDVGNLVVCPTVYNRSWAGDGSYLVRMGQGLNPDIEIMWTGNSVCDMIDAPDCEYFTGKTGRKPFIWLNYPVNDYGMHNLLMGPMTGNDPAIAPMVDAFCSNPMQYAEASKVALYQIGDFCWNPTAYNDTQSWLGALKELQPDHAEAFQIFCENNFDVGQSVHGLRLYGETPSFTELCKKYPTLDSQEACVAFRQWFASRRNAANELLMAADAGDPLLLEVREWLVALQLQALQGLEITAMADALLRHDSNEFIEAYKAYVMLRDEASEIVSRGFEGSIQSVRVQTGTLHVVPWMKQFTSSLINEFKQSGASYPADLFPEQVLPNGTYYIMWNGKRLGNPDAGGKGGSPVWQDGIDDINPNRQEWHIKLDPVTGRYSIINSKDERYLNEICRFGVNPYSADWNTYEITKKDGKYAIRNGGNGGNDFWGCGGGILQRAEYGEPHYIFEFIPVAE